MFGVGKESGASTLAADTIALTYISNIPMLIVVDDDRAGILAKMIFAI